MTAKGSRFWIAVRAFLVVVVLALLARALGSESWRRGFAQIERAGWPLLLVLLATPAALGLDAVGWRQILRNLGSPQVSWWSLARIRLISEAPVLALPGGAAIAEATKLALLGKLNQVIPSMAAASLALARALHLTGAAVYLGLVGVLAATLPSGSMGARKVGILVFSFGSAALTLLVSRVALALLRRAGLARRLADRLQQIPWRRLSEVVARNRRHLDAIDAHTAHYFRASSRRRWWAGVPFALQWLAEGAETALILTLLGANIGWRGSLVLDATTSFARAVVIFLPAGLGVQEATQVFLLHLLGARDEAATAAALIFMKRTKELFWIVTGVLLAAVTRDAWQSRAQTEVRTPTQT